MRSSAPVNGDGAAPEARYEFRVWGERAETSRMLSKLAADERKERLSDCYLLGSDPHCNTKIRRHSTFRGRSELFRSRLKVKRLQEERKGFQRWSASWLRAPGDAPKPLDRLLKELRNRDLPAKEYERRLAQVVDQLDPDGGLRTVFVTKHRRRYRFGTIRAESTNVKIVGRSGSLSTVAIEGPDLGDLVRLRKSLGLVDQPNVALHLAVDPRRK